MPATPPSLFRSGTEVDEGEEAYVKMALRRALEQQVEIKDHQKKVKEKEDLQQQQHVLNCVAKEMQQARFREMAQRRERSDVLSDSWQKQQKLKQIERGLDKAL